MKSDARARVVRSIALLVGVLAVAAPVRAETAEDPAESIESAGDAPSAPEGRAVYDPWEKMNRGIFAFNETLDHWLIEPIAIGWDTVVPDPAERGIANFFDNIAIPRRLVNDLLQLKLYKAGNDLGRFAINTTFGVLGLFDPASAEGIARGDEDFGQTLGFWGVPAGPYLVLPFFGGSSPRDAVGLAVDVFLAPEFYFAPWYVSVPTSSVRIVNARSLSLETIRAERASAFDFYAAVRSAYVQYRTNQVRDRSNEPEGQDEDEDLYKLEEDQ